MLSFLTASEAALEEGRSLLIKGDKEAAAVKLKVAVKFFEAKLKAKKHSTSYYALGRAYYYLEDYKKAKKNFLSAINRDRDNTQYRFMYGVACKKNDDLNTAIRELKKVLKLDPKHANAHFELGQSFRLKQKAEEAMNHYKSCVKYNPRHATAFQRHP